MNWSRVRILQEAGSLASFLELKHGDMLLLLKGLVYSLILLATGDSS
jgi:hypothetical protein